MDLDMSAGDGRLRETQGSYEVFANGKTIAVTRRSGFWISI